MNDMRIGVDLGGTKTEVIALADDGTILVRHRVHTPAGNYNAVLDTVAELVATAEQSTGPMSRIGIGTPGAISPNSSLMRNSNSVVLNGRPLDRDLADRLRRQVRLENDANCFTLSEAIDGAASAFKVVFGVILGTGVGGGIVIDKKLLPGRNKIAGEWGHNPLPWTTASDLAGVPCYCGKSGCIETYLSGAGLSRGYKALTGRDMTAVEIAGAATNGDREARACMKQYVDQLARSLASIINVLDPDTIVLGGGLSNIMDLYSTIPSIIGEYVFSDHVATPVLRALHGDSSGVRGAAWLW